MWKTNCNTFYKLTNDSLVNVISLIKFIFNKYLIKIISTCFNILKDHIIFAELKIINKYILNTFMCLI